MWTAGWTYAIVVVRRKQNTHGETTMDNREATLETIREICISNVEGGWDQRHEYSPEGLLEGDAYLQNVVDTLVEMGICTDENYNEAVSLFCTLAEERGLRFYTCEY